MVSNWNYNNWYLVLGQIEFEKREKIVKYNFSWVEWGFVLILSFTATNLIFIAKFYSDFY